MSDTAWFTDARFGMFIQWGIYSNPCGIWEGQKIKHEYAECLINSRIRFLQPSDRVDFISTMDNTFPDEGFDKPWETSGTLNDSWAYHQLDFAWKQTEDLIKFLIGNASLGGNDQLNVRSTGAGEFQPAAVKQLIEIGACPPPMIQSWPSA